MCWSTEASIVWATAGVVATGYLIAKREPPALWLTLGYFTLIEILQAASYPVLDQCGSRTNQTLTALSYIHLCFQPFIFNMLAMHFIPDDLRLRIRKPVYALCGVAAVYMMAQALPLPGTGACDPARSLCAERLCTVSGEWHLAWEIPMNSLGNGLHDHWFWPLRVFRHGLVGYALMVMVAPILYGAWRLSAFQYLMGPILASSLTSNVDEVPAIWCLMSIGIAFAIIYTPLRQLFYVRRAPVWLGG